MAAHDKILELKSCMAQSIIGQEKIIERLLIGLLTNGNLLVEGLPGLAKTRAVKSLAKYMEAGFSRIQFTPDLLPSDITGNEVLFTEGDQQIFKFQQGPIFSNIVLADEINRAPAKVQAALLEAMEERQVTVAGTTHKLPELFMVMATQNPIEQEGTYPLPEAQMDRFIMHVNIGYPDEASEAEIMRLVRSEEQNQKETKAKDRTKPEAISQQSVFEAREEITALHASEAIEQYIVSLVFASRYPERYSKDLANWIQVGASPRGTLGLDHCARAYAWLHKRDHVTPDDVRAIVHDVLRHRIMLSYEANADGITSDQVIDDIVKRVAVA